MQANFDESRQSQLPFVELLLAMGYRYISTEDALKERGENTSKFFLRNIAFEKLKEINSFEYNGKVRKFTDTNIENAIDELENIPLEGLQDTAKEVYNSLMITGGKTIKEFVEGKSKSFSFRFIDFENPENNVFHVAVEFTAQGKKAIRPDIVCFINGIPFVVIENKKSSIVVTEALTQLNGYQQASSCPRLFLFPQLLIGTNGKELRYGTTKTPNKFFAKWKEKEMSEQDLENTIQNYIAQPIEKTLYQTICTDLNGATKNHTQLTERATTQQDKGVVALLNPARLLNLTKNYILFDAGLKKISRYQQFFAIDKVMNQIQKKEPGVMGEKRKGGIVWHTQGSGKSLTMVLLVKAIIENPEIKNPRIIIVTDRIDLDKQIKGTFKHCNLKKNVTQASSGKKLLELITEKSSDVITTLVHKFESAKRSGGTFQDLDENIFVLIDEAHRTQGGMANAEMNRTIPNACFIAFTGTPLLKDEKSQNKFGEFIDKYTIDDALEDGVILPLVYEGRYTEMSQKPEKIDRFLERLTDTLSDTQIRELKKFISTKVIKANPQRIAEIACDIEDHFIQYFKNTGLKAQLVAPSKYSALLFQKFFEESGNINTAIVISQTQRYDDETDEHTKEIGEFLQKVSADYKNHESYEESVIESFKNNLDGIEVLIVVDKLLTGFDAPRNTVLYLTKDLKDHNLLQAIARVNRLFDNAKKPKTAGYIVDYSENARNIKTAMELFGSYDKEDVKSVLVDTQEKINNLKKSYAHLENIFKTIKNKKDDEVYITHLADEEIRDGFYKSFTNFVKNFDECLSLQNFATKFSEIDMYKRDMKRYAELRGAARLQYADTEDLSEYKSQLVKILDQYIDAEKVELLTSQVNIHDVQQFEETLAQLGSDTSKAEAIASQMKRTITEKLDSDPEFYRKFSDKISDVLQKLREGKISDIEALTQMQTLKHSMIEKKDEDLPDSISSVPGADILYRNLKKDFDEMDISESLEEDVTLHILGIIQQEAIVDWQKNDEVQRVIRNKIDDYLYDEIREGKRIEITNEQMSTIVRNAVLLAKENHEIFSVSL